MSDIQAIRERHEKDKKFFAKEWQLPWEQDDCILAVTDIATLLSLLSAAEARAEAAEAILQQMLTAEVEYSEGIPCGYGPPLYTALELAIMAREALDTLKGIPDGR